MANGDFDPIYSTNNIWYDTYTGQNLTDHLEDMKADIDTLQTSKANTTHTHTGYAFTSHSHSEYALTSHSHNEYALSTHSHSYDDLTDKPNIPTTLPANGGNSDTVDGKHAADFATAESVDMLQELVGGTSVQSQISTAVNAVTPAGIGAAEEDHIHSYNDLTHKPTALPANGGDADTVDGKHASEFATLTSVSALETLVGNTSVQSQISSAIENHTHSYNDLTHKPESLPANGGNADTVGNKHASDFATVESVDMLQTLVGGASVQSQITAAIGGITPSDIGAAVSTHTHSYNDLTDKPTGSGATLVDSISEEGASGNWTYRKWENGTSEAWYYESFGEIELRSLSSFSVWSNDAYNARNVDFPVGLFNSTPMAVCNAYSNSYTFSQVASATKDSMVFRIWAPSGMTVDNVSIVIYVVGKWK